MNADGEHFDLLCLGRLGVDLYGEQDGTPLERVQTFAKYVGGSAANVCVGVARLGLSTAMCSRVGDEGLGKFVLDTLSMEGVNAELVQRDPLHPTGVVTLALYKRESFPRIFFYRDSADLSFEQDKLDWNVVDRSSAVLLTGSYLVNESLFAVSHAVAESIHRRGGRVVLDVDYRPVLWGLVPVGEGNDMQTSDARVSAVYQRILPLCDLVVGTEEEIAVAGASSDIDTALREIRSLTDAAIVLKRGAKGASVYEGPIPADLDDGVGAPGYVVEVLNNTGAGDAFLSGFLSRWLRNRPLRECVLSGNASGAIVVTRNGCTPAMPFADEQERFMALGGIARPDDDQTIERLHRVGSRRPTVPWRLLVSLRDHDLRELLGPQGGSPDRVNELARLLGSAIFHISDGEHAIGILADAVVDREILEAATHHAIFVARSLDAERGQRDGRGETEIGVELRSWNGDIVPAAGFAVDADRSPVECEDRWHRITLCARTCRLMEREILVELLPEGGTDLTALELERHIIEGYRAGVQPEYWMLPEVADPHGWSRIAELIFERDPSCRGYFIRAKQNSPLHRAEPALEVSRPACRGVVAHDLCDPSVLRAWSSGSLNNAEFTDALRIGLRQMAAHAPRVSI